MDDRQDPQNDERGGWLGAAGVAVGAGLLVMGVGMYMSGRQMINRVVMAVHAAPAGKLMHPATMPEFVRGLQLTKLGGMCGLAGLVILAISAVVMMREDGESGNRN